ncbi:hypothetical protein M413DRAFT_323372 [Hebeloma cylindrosporum]|uniref:Uncharacterized protein n=1 Tax=Hebeloma cylindrosporum TaxID=76867 RepID=A0A0C3BX38_HEBCY|nr:hypothetical protein M413DRAFT_323372 [Hebeloma cylindrosporum h7]
MTSPRQNNRSFVLRSDGVRERKSAMVRLIARFRETRRVFKDRQVARDRLVGCYSHLTIVVVFTLNPSERLMSGQRVYEVRIDLDVHVNNADLGTATREENAFANQVGFRLRVALGCGVDSGHGDGVQQLANGTTNYLFIVCA